MSQLWLPTYLSQYDEVMRSVLQSPYGQVPLPWSVVGPLSAHATGARATPLQVTVAAIIVLVVTRHVVGQMPESSARRRAATDAEQLLTKLVDDSCVAARSRVAAGERRLKGFELNTLIAALGLSAQTLRDPAIRSQLFSVAQMIIQRSGRAKPETGSQLAEFEHEASARPLIFHYLNPRC